MPNLIVKDAALSALSESYRAEKELYEQFHNVVRGGVVQGIVQASAIIKEQTEVSEVNRAEILRLCNDIEDEVTDIAFNSTHYHIRDCCNAIREYLQAIGKELNGDAET